MTRHEDDDLSRQPDPGPEVCAMFGHFMIRPYPRYIRCNATPDQRKATS